MLPSERLPPGNLAEDLDPDADNHDRAEDRQRNGQDTGQRIHSIRSNRAEASGERGSNGGAASLSDSSLLL